MLNREIEQGTVIYGIRSEKYPLIPCYGVVINARCDIAQKKIPKYYYLVGVDASEWFCSEHGYQQTYTGIIKQKANDICTSSNKLELDGKTLLAMPEASVRIVLEDKKNEVSGKRSLENEINCLSSKFNQYYELVQREGDTASRRLYIQKNSKTAIQYLKDIDSGKVHHYYFLPQDAYLGNRVKDKGLIIDMLEIGILSIADTEKIISPFSSGICFAALPRLPEPENIESEATLKDAFKQISEYIRLTTSFWLNDASDFVDIEGTIASPWCEHLMQRFSNVFIRIGLENPTEDDFKKIIDDCFREEIR